MLFAVHLSDVLSEPWWIGGWVVAATLVAWSARGIGEREIPQIGVLAAAFFVASQVHLPLGGASVHLLLNGLVGVVLGRRAAVAIAAGVLLQTLLFGHGGFTTLGVNVVILAVPALLAGSAVRRLRPDRLVRVPSLRFFAVFLITALWIASALVAAQWVHGKIVTAAGPLAPDTLWMVRNPELLALIVLAAALLATLEGRIETDPDFPLGLLLGAGTAYASVSLNCLVLALGGKPEVRDLAGIVILAHLPVVVVESVGLGFVVAFLARAKPEWLGRQRSDGSGNTSSNGTSH